MGLLVRRSSGKVEARAEWNPVPQIQVNGTSR